MGVPPRRYSTIAYAIWYSSAVGYLHITDANDVDAPLDFDPITINGYVRARMSTFQLLTALQKRGYCSDALGVQARARARTADGAASRRV